MPCKHIHIPVTLRTQSSRCKQDFVLIYVYIIICLIYYKYIKEKFDLSTAFYFLVRSESKFKN